MDSTKKSLAPSENHTHDKALSLARNDIAILSAAPAVLLKAGLDVTWIVQGEYDSLEDFEQGIGKFDRHEALKVIFYPHGRS